MSSKRIQELKKQIENANNNIKTTKINMARMRENNGPKHYQESGKKSIETQKSIIKRYKQEIATIKNKEKSMGKATDSFKREIGKNTGKWVSNKIFGDGHSTPHRVSVNVQKEQIKSDLIKAQLKADKQQQKRENRKELFNKGLDLLSDKEGKNEKLTINSKKEEIISTPIPNDIDEIMNFVNFLLSTIKANGWKAGDNEKHINLLSDACLIKLEQCEIKLKSINEINQASYVESEIKKLKKKKLIQKYLLFVGIGIMFIVGFILYKLGLLK